MSKGETKSAELEQRVKEYNEEHTKLLGKHDLALSARAFIAPDGRVMAQPIVMDGAELRQKEQESADAGLESVE